MMKRSWLVFALEASDLPWRLMPVRNSFTVQLKNGQGEDVGTAKISPGGGGVRIILEQIICRPASTPFTFTRWPSVKVRSSKRRVLTSILTPSNTEP